MTMEIQSIDTTWQTFLDDFSSTLDENTCYFDSFQDEFTPFFSSPSSPDYERSKFGKFPRKSKQRHAANLRERKRMRSINEAFDGLRVRVPASRMDKKISKVDTLKCAIDYIHQLKDLLRASELQGKQDKKKKVILRCRIPEQSCPDGIALPYAHSLSWDDQRELKYGSNKTLRAKLWIPEVSTPEPETS